MNKYILIVDQVCTELLYGYTEDEALEYLYNSNYELFLKVVNEKRCGPDAEIFLVDDQKIVYDNIVEVTDDKVIFTYMNNQTEYLIKNLSTYGMSIWKIEARTSNFSKNKILLTKNIKKYGTKIPFQLLKSIFDQPTSYDENSEFKMKIVKCN